MLTKLAVASKAHWGYSQDLLDLWMPELVFTPDNIHSRTVTVVEDNHIPVAVSSLDTSTDTPELDGLWVDPSSLNKGIGKRLLAHTLGLARQMGIDSVKVVSDPNAAGFYKLMGANQTGWQASVPTTRRLPVFNISTLLQEGSQ